MGQSVAVVSMLALAAEAVHPLREAQIKTINGTLGVLWEAAAQPRFANDKPGASWSLNGVLPGSRKHLEHMIDLGEVVQVTADANVLIPGEFDSSSNWPQCAKVISDIRD